MGLNGSLDDFSLQDILQILALGRKTGCLTLETPSGAGTVLFREGRILASLDGGASLPPTAPSPSLPPGERDEVVRERIAASLDRFARCRQGEFRFRVTTGSPLAIVGRDVTPEILPSGIDVIELLLEVAWRHDEEERRSSDPERTGRRGDPSVLLVDDEELVRRLLGRYLVEGGYQVVEAGDVESAVTRGASLAEAGVRFVLVADLNMPATAGDSFRGGFEVVRRLARLRPRPPVVMMTDGASASPEPRPMRGVWSVVLKPGLSKLDPEEFEADMRRLAGKMVREVLPRVCAALPA